MKYKIKRSLISDIFVAAKNNYPNEFLCFLGSTNNNNIIDEIIFFPTQTDENSASIDLNHFPIGLNIIASVHSHPNNYITPSKADLEFFLNYKINIIIGVNNENNYKMFDNKGNIIFIEVI